MNDPLPETPERLLSAMRALMRSRATRPLAELAHRATLTRGGDLRLGRAVHRIYPRPDNASVAAAVACHPTRLLGWICRRVSAAGWKSAWVAADRGA